MMKIRKLYSISYSFFSLLMILTLLIPAQEMMLWCDMTDMGMSMDHKNMTMQEHHKASSENSHHDSKASETDSPSQDHCNMLVDCNCLMVQNRIKEQAVLTISSSTRILPVAPGFLTLFELQFPVKEIFPPPAWRYASYSSPDLFLKNESFLI